ncbi:MAG: hypothetical protein HN742_22825 [Lentisphaerae bacterium]|nr:hypothetical protein [Lentisphaerota bacterium]MBT5606194.1 hypothetical protein [Lentisphaerota bacterium]MBT7060416.1 hypothetical protein [Lentisphaerota bacterium]MBT7844730.1 hypothetical protein [Lentisphaerota bacterium]
MNKKPGVISYVLAAILVPTAISHAITPIAHTDVVPYQRIEHGASFNVGVVAFSMAGIDRVDFAIAGQGYSGGVKSTSAMTLNTRVASTSPGAVYPGVYEYYVPVSADDFTGNGTIAVTPTVYGGDGGVKTLRAVTLYVEGASNESPTLAWVDGDGSDGTGTLNDETDPFPSIQTAMDAIDSRNRTLDYATIYLTEGVYDTNDRVSGTTDTTTEWVTIASAREAEIEKVIIDEDGTLWDTDHIRFSGVTLRNSGPRDPAAAQTGAWFDGCRIIGPGGYGNHSPIGGSHNAYFTGCLFYNVGYVMPNTPVLGRGLRLEKIYHDVARNGSPLLVNIQVDGMYGEHPTPYHSDVYQVFDQVEDIIIYNGIFVDLQYQGLFLNSEGGTSRNAAFVNLLFEYGAKTPGGSRSWIHDQWDHLLLWHCTFGSRLAADGDWFMLWDAAYPDADPFERSNVSYIGNVFHRFGITGSAQRQLGARYLDSGNPYGNEARYNHFCTRGMTVGENYTTGEGVIDFDAPGSATFGYPVRRSVIVDRLPSDLTGVPCDARGNPRDANPDAGALEAR